MTTNLDHLIDPQRQALAPMYDPAFERDACGVGLVVDIKGRASRDIVERALAGLVNLTHRGGVGADARTGDGAGILTQIPTELFAAELAALGAPDLTAGDFGVGMLFLPAGEGAADTARSLVADALAARGFDVIGFRVVPVDAGVLGHIAASTQPVIEQVFLRRNAADTVDAFERSLMLARRAIERAWIAAGVSGADVISLSCRTVIYKGFCLPEDLAAFYADLRDHRFESAIALFHQRYSTNTLPTWAMAQPFRFLAHNGEINTVQGNRNWMMARASTLAYADGIGGDELQPIVSLTGSDSLSLDNALELLYHSGRSLPHALMMLVPEPWEQLKYIEPERRAFYDFHAGMMEQWDGPAALAFSDGVRAGATLDRNGLRPFRYAITADGLFIAGSEAGTVVIEQSEIIEKGRLGPGQMIVVDTERGEVLRNAEIKHEVASSAPYAEWLKQRRVTLPGSLELPGSTPVEQLAAIQRAFGYSGEDARLIVNPMAGEQKEPTWSMGDDAPLAVLSARQRPLSAFFRQRFAQVTNPPIDSLREKKVMALDAYIGPRANILVESAQAAEIVHLPSVVLTEHQFNALATIDSGNLQGIRLSTLFPVSDGVSGLTATLDRLTDAAIQAVQDGFSVIALSDRGVNAELAAAPMVLVVGTLHQALIRAGLRMQTDLVVETGEVWDVHQLACLIGYGASAVHPYLALAAAAALEGQRGYDGLTKLDLQQNYIGMVEYGFLKICSKMGISTAAGYRGAQIFEAIGIGDEVIERAFAGTPSKLGGIGFEEIAEDVLARHAEAFATPDAKLPDPGFLRYRKDGEAHGYSPVIAKAIQKFSETNDPTDYNTYYDMVKAHPKTAVRDLIAIKPLAAPISVDEVEPAEAIISRFIVTAMSLGALSPEAFRTLAIAMNRMGARSNSGEGGEDPDWYDETGADIPHSKVKQVASGRFGVTARYLAMATELEIKMAQGSKPGEGGQLPGHKVTQFVAKVRHAVPGLPLISPPPHHDIYSIEDLAQLIYDLRQVNPRAKIGVKLVAEAGVGTIAAGVAKARADYILISGHSGGTGASPIASIKFAGSPWELGLAETQQTLVMNGLRSRVKLRTDGGIKTPKDVLVATMLGAEEIGFGTSVLIAIGCDMARQCHLNSCPTGIATQKEDLRKKFAGDPQMVITYFQRLAQGVREELAAMGARSLDELVGRSDLLEQTSDEGRAALLDLSSLFAEPADATERKKSMDTPLEAGRTLDEQMLDVVGPALQDGRAVSLHETIQTKDRTVGARIAGQIALTHGATALPPGRVTLHYHGSAGQSFGAFSTHGMRMVLEGEANDYVGKGMMGGEIAVRPPREASFTTPQVIAGNTLLYGATGGEVYLAGRAGERFAVRNSGATAVVEGVGDHGCEYMTGGLVAVLGTTGRNFGAGMTNGFVYVWDEDGLFSQRMNDESVLSERVSQDGDSGEFRALVQRHVEMTGSARGQALLDNWDATIAQSWKVIPRALIELQAAQDEAEAAASVAD
jgi:glutamate synthase domain-containing protein 2/glutamate synthase domain-containing protein 1/glutamate synthase domain-containing protein 3